MWAHFTILLAECSRSGFEIRMHASSKWVDSAMLMHSCCLPSVLASQQRAEFEPPGPPKDCKMHKSLVQSIASTLHVTGTCNMGLQAEWGEDQVDLGWVEEWPRLSWAGLMRGSRLRPHLLPCRHALIGRCWAPKLGWLRCPWSS